MKSEVSEILIPIPSGRNTDSNLTVMKAIFGCTFVILLGLAFVRYELRITDLEIRLEQLEIESIRKESIEEIKTEKRTKREIHSEGIPPWVKRSGQGDPVVNQEYLDFLRIRSQQARASDDDSISSEEAQPQTTRSRSNVQLRSGGTGRRRTPNNLIRNDADETFFTRNADGSIVSPKGLKEIWERLPPVSSEVTYETSGSNLQTRAGRSEGVEAAPVQIPPVERVGTGADQVSARVVRYGDRKTTTQDVAIAAHYVADVSNFTTNENPRLRNSNGIFQLWKAAEWMTGNNFVLDRVNGVVTVRNDGIYHIYSQIHYQDEQENSFIVEVNGQPLLQCTTTQQSNSCYTGGLAHLKANDKIIIKNVGIDRFSIYAPEKTFFGMVKVGNAP